MLVADKVHQNGKAEEAQNGSGEATQSLYLRPVVFIGVGGTGHRILLYLKAMFIALMGYVPSGVRLIAIDTDDENLALRVGDQMITLERDREFFYIGRVPVAGIIRNIANLETIAERLPHIRALPPLAMLDGAAQNRTLGLLALLWHYDAVQRVVRDALWELTHRENLGEIGGVRVDASRGVHSFLCGSLCGGTHAGQFPDMAYLLRSELDRLGEIADFSKVIGLGMLPDAFRHAAGPNLIPNTYAALAELNRMMVRGGFRARYRNGHVVETPRPPFDLYYIQGAVAEDGRTQLSRDELCRQAAQGLYHLALTPIGGRQRSVFDNVAHVLAQRTADGHGTFFASFGVAELYFPAAEVAEWCQMKQARGLVRELLSMEAGTVEADVVATVQALELTGTGLRAQLAVDDTGLPLITELAAPSWVSSLEPHSVPGQLTSWVQAIQRERVEGDYRLWIRENAAQLRTALEAALQARVEQAADERGVAHARALAARLAEVAQQVAAPLAARRQSLEGQHATLLLELEDAVRSLTQAAQASWITRFLEKPLAQATERYLKMAEALLATEVERMVTERALALAVAVEEQARSLSRAQAAVVKRLQSVERQLTQRAAQLTEDLLRVHGPAAALGTALVDEAYLQQLYAAHAAPLAALAEALDAQGSRHAWTALSSDELMQRVTGVTVAPFAPIRQMTVEAAIQARAGQMSAHERKQLLMAMARPAWNLEETRLPHGGARLARVTLLGVPDAERTLYDGGSDQLVSTGDPQRIVAFAMTAGVPATALRPWTIYEQAYQMTLDPRMLHVLPDFRQDAQEAALALGLALLFGFIEEQRANFYYRPTDELAKRRFLGRGKSQVLESLVEAELVSELLARAEREVQTQGVEAVQAQMAAFCQPAAHDDGTSRKMKRLVRSYAAQL